jgi:hypothetical protein
MPFQYQVNIQTAPGIPGELYDEGPLRAEPLIVNSNGASPNTVGFAYTKDNQYNIASVGGVIAVGTPFAGILVNPKAYASFGSSAGTLAPTLDLPDNAQGEFLTMGTIFVRLTTAASIGDWVIYDTTTGALAAVSPGDAAPAGFALIPNAVVHRFTAPTGGGTAVIRLTN